MSRTTHDLITEAAALVCGPVELREWHSTEAETLDQYDDAISPDVDAAYRERVEQWIADSRDALLRLRYVHDAANGRAEQYKREADRWIRKGAEQARLAEYCKGRARDILVCERRLAGLDEGEKYRVEFPNGMRIGLRITQSVNAADVDALPPELVRVKTIREPDKVAIGARLKAGEDVPGAVLVTTERCDWGR